MNFCITAEAESKEKHVVWDPMPIAQVAITSLYVHSRVDSNTFTMGNLYQKPYTKVDFFP
jgi:hypothetical protein